MRDNGTGTGAAQLIAVRPEAEETSLAIQRRTAADLSPREVQVLNRVKRLCSRRPDGWVEVEMVGSARTVERLRLAGLVRVELWSLGPLGGRYFRIQAVES